MKLISRIDGLLDRAAAWAKGHEAFIAVNVTRALAIVFIIVSFIFLMKSIANT